MFTGIVEEVGTIDTISRRAKSELKKYSMEQRSETA